MFLLALVLAATPPKSYTVTSVPTVVTSKFQLDATSYVIGSDGTPRSCPNVKGVGPYVRPEGKGAAMNFFYLPPGQVLRSTDKVSYTLVCLKVETWH